MITVTDIKNQVAREIEGSINIAIHKSILEQGNLGRFATVSLSQFTKFPKILNEILEKFKKAGWLVEKTEYMHIYKFSLPDDV